VRRHLTLIFALLISVFALAACGDDSTVTTSGDDSTTAAETTAATTETEEEPASGASGCKQVEQPGPKTVESSKPKEALAKDKTYTVVLTTSCGKIEIRLDQKENPKTAASFAKLVKTGFFDGLSFHRVVPGFVIQGGDPSGDGSGGPDYSVVEAPPKDQAYVKGVVAMAKTAAEKPGTSGSQFFIVTGEDAGLPAEYAVAGKVVGGQDVADKIGNIPPSNGQDGPPSEPVIIEKATLKVS